MEKLFEFCYRQVYTMAKGLQQQGAKQEKIQTQLMPVGVSR